MNATIGLAKPHHYIRVTSAMKADLRMWLQFLQHCNGISLFHDRFWLSNETIQLFTDASGSHGTWEYILKAAGLRG